MTLPELRHAVWLEHCRVGTLLQRGDHTRFVFEGSYLGDAARPVLGLRFEDDLAASHAAALRLPAWFSNLLPEGALREWIASDRGVSPHREMELLAHVGHDLPGAVRISPDLGDLAVDWSVPPGAPPASASEQASGLRFSLAGVALKFSMLQQGDRLTLPAHGMGGDWIVKLPDRSCSHVPANEHTMMTLARHVGIATPDVRLVHRDDLDSLPPSSWAATEDWAYAVRRFDRTTDRGPIHIEDFAQVRGFYPEGKYDGNYETVASLCYRGGDIEGLREFARRLAFCVLISNSDAHLKNWSLIYPDGRRPTLAPAYDLVCTDYPGIEQRLGLRFGGSRRFSQIRMASFARLERRLAVAADLCDIVSAVIARTREYWPMVAPMLSMSPALQTNIAQSLAERGRTLAS